MHRPTPDSHTRHGLHVSETELGNVDADHDLINGGDLTALVRATLAMEENL